MIDNAWGCKCKDKGGLQWCRLKMSLVPGACENSSSTLVKLKVFFGMPGDSSQKRTCAPEQLIFYFDDTG